MPRHIDDLRNVNEGDTVTIETTSGERFAQVECAEYHTSRTDESSGEVRETHLWLFSLDSGKELTVSIVCGLRSSSDDPEFPVHKEGAVGVVGQTGTWTPVGFFESVEIHEI